MWWGLVAYHSVRLCEHASRSHVEDAVGSAIHDVRSVLQPQTTPRRIPKVKLWWLVACCGYLQIIVENGGDITDAPHALHAVAEADARVIHGIPVPRKVLLAAFLPNRIAQGCFLHSFCIFFPKKSGVS